MVQNEIAAAILAQDHDELKPIASQVLKTDATPLGELSISPLAIVLVKRLSVFIE